MHGKGRWVQEVTAGSKDRQGRSNTTAGRGMAMPGMAEDDGKQLLAKSAIPKLTAEAEATGHPRVPKGLAGADHPSCSCAWKKELWGRKELWGGPDPPSNATRWV